MRALVLNENGVISTVGHYPDKKKDPNKYDQ